MEFRCRKSKDKFVCSVWSQLALAAILGAALPHPATAQVPGASGVTDDRLIGRMLGIVKWRGS